MPFTNFHSARMHNPDNYDRFSYQNKDSKTGINFVLGWKDGKSEIQAVRFKKNKYTPAEAKKWMKDNDKKYIKFEPAKESILMSFKEYLHEAKQYVLADSEIEKLKKLPFNKIKDLLNPEEQDFAKAFIKSIINKEELEYDMHTRAKHIIIGKLYYEIFPEFDIDVTKKK